MSHKENELRAYLPRLAKEGVCYVYNTKFDKENVGAKIQTVHKPKNLSRRRILSNRETNFFSDNGLGTDKKGGDLKRPHPDGGVIISKKVAAIENEILTSNVKAKERKIEKNIAAGKDKYNIMRVHSKTSGYTSQSDTTEHKDTLMMVLKNSHKPGNTVENFNGTTSTSSENVHIKNLGILKLDTETNPVSNCVLYNEDYREDFIQHLVKQEIKQLFEERTYEPCQYFLSAYEKFYKTLLFCTDIIDIRSDMIYTSTYIFSEVADYFKYSGQIELVALASISIAMKYACRYPPDLIGKCATNYATQDIINIEWSILQSLDFHIYYVDPKTFVSYYILNLKLENPQLIWNCSNYILNCAVLHVHVNTYAPSKLAAAAVLISLERMDISFCWELLSTSSTFYPKEKLKTLCSIMWKHVHVAKKHYSHHYMFGRYSLPEYDFVADRIFNNN